jgi:CspA family cold shock protein
MSILHGVVTSFDPAIGLGEVRTEDGRVFPFHCIEIADGTRRVEVGASVTFRLIAKLGAYEAAALQPG